mmetsp:Transcript_42219/g.105156  ORF Transcript_42219/g.105156 Transcript_42219/m.105156 type:complete len:234 (+) Transcript_42219:40-741(+)
MAEVPLISSFSDTRLRWENGTPQHELIEDGAGMRIIPTPHLDYWSRTFYQPLLLKHDAQCLLTPISQHAEATLSTAFTLAPRAQFDQAGIMVLVDEKTWVKAGIEFTDGVPRLSCVVTNDGFSDWSTQKWTHWDATDDTTAIRVRVSKLLPGEAQGPTLVFEAAPYSDNLPGTHAEWFQVRIASLRSGNQPWQMGFFASSPIRAAGCSATFHHMHLGPKESPVHSVDPQHAAI